MIKLLHGDCLAQMKTLDDNSVDSIVSDPPYGISFMAKKWDYDVPSVEVWKEAMRVLKPGGHALIACGTRTQHRMVCNIEDAGFEIRDVVSWIYGSGFPKSLNISKAIDKRGGHNVSWFGDWLRKWRQDNSITQKEIAKLFPSKTGNLTGCVANWELGLNLPTCEQFNTIIQAFNLPFKDIYEAEREVVGSKTTNKTVYQAIGEQNTSGEIDITAPATEAAKQWDGWGTALKPACEFFTLCRKPLSEKTIAANVLKWGTGGINIDGCRVGTETIKTCAKGKDQSVTNKKNGDERDDKGRGWNGCPESAHQGRFPANLIHDGSQEVLDLFPETKTNANNKGSSVYDGTSNHTFGKYAPRPAKGQSTDKGSAARFFYCPKASKKDRNEGCEELEDKSTCEHEGRTGQNNSASRPDGSERKPALSKNNHPTVKPTALMAYLCRLITPTGGVVLDPYMGSGSTGKAAVQEGFSFVGCELDKDYFDIATARVTNGQDLEVRGEDF
jgi:DNA modification methylase